jgi:hypothetical protein
MILKASQRGGGAQLAAHLQKTEENEHVEIGEVSGFVSETVDGALKEAAALARGTRAKQYLFSVSLNPPAGENVSVETFEHALRMIEDRLGLAGQPRVVVYHEKEGRRHCHAVFSRIDAESMTAKPLPFFKSKLRDIAKQLYLDNGWKLPEGFRDSKLRDPRTFNLQEWQQAKRAGLDPKQLKAAALECWASSDDTKSFAKAMEERGLFVAQGDRRSHVAVTVDGDVFPISRLVGKRTKEVAARLGSADNLPTIEATRAMLSGAMADRLKSHIREAKRIASNAMKPLVEERAAMKLAHGSERQKLDQGMAKRFKVENAARAARVRGGVMGVWDMMTGRYSRARKANEAEAFFSMQRDRAQRQALVSAQLKDRRELQSRIVQARTRHAQQVLGLYRDAARFRAAQENRAQSPNRSLDFGR